MSELYFHRSFNPYFTGLPILITADNGSWRNGKISFNPYFTGLPILITSSISILI